MMNVRNIILPRKKTAEKLASSIDEYPLVVLTAPAGYGKSTEARALMETCERRVLYAVFMPGNLSERHLSDMFFRQLSELDLDLQQEVEANGYLLDDAHAGRTLEFMSRALDAVPTLLVIDDQHYGNSAGMNSFLERLARRALPNLSILLLTRNRPSLQLEDMRIKGVALVLAQDFLAFSLDEAVEFFQMAGISDPEVATRAWRQSEGWPAALWLSLQSYLSNGAISPVNDLEKLISETIFYNYDQESQSLLLRLSLLNSFTLKQAVLISGDPMAKRRLLQLYDNNAFLRYSADGKGYRMHSIFRSFLLGCLEEGSEPASISIDRPDLYRRAGECRLQDKDYLQALEFFHKAGRDEDYLQMLKLFELPHKAQFISYDPDGIAAKMAAIPWHVRRQCFIGYLAFIYFYMYRESLEKGLPLLREAEQALAADAAISETDKRRYLGEIEAVRALEYLNDLEKICEQYKKAYALLNGPSTIVKMQAVWVLHVYTGLAHLRSPGGYSRIIELIRENKSQFRVLGGGFTAGLSELYQAEYYLEIGAFAEVKQWLHAAKLHISSKREPSLMIRLALLTSRLHIAEGQLHRAWEPFEKVRRKLAETDTLLDPKALELAMSRIADILNQSEKLPAWLLARDMPTNGRLFPNYGYKLLVYAKAFLTAQDWQTLEYLLDEGAKRFDSDEYFSTVTRIHFLVLKAIQSMKSEEIYLSHDYLRKAIELARPDGLVTSIAEYGVHLYPLLLHQQNLNPDDDFVVSLCKLTGKYVMLGTSLSQLLSPREKVILESAISGESNRRIGEKIGMATGSVANALSRIYVKLGINNRKEAKAVIRNKYDMR